MKKSEKKMKKFVFGDRDDQLRISIEMTGRIDFKSYSAKEAEMLEKIRKWIRSMVIESEIEKLDAQE